MANFASEIMVSHALLAIACVFSTPRAAPRRRTEADDCEPEFLPFSAAELPLPAQRNPFRARPHMKELGEGGFGKVYRSIHPLTGKPCALKFVSWATPEQKQAVVDEFGLMCHFGARSCNVMAPQYLQMGDAEACLAMAWCRGTLGSFVEARARVLDEAMVLALGMQMARGLHCLHAGSVIHGDLKPGNILMTYFPSSAEDLDADCVKLSDFGLSRTFKEAQHGSPGGTPGWVAPEVARQMRTRQWEPVGPACDVWALGAILYYLFCSGLAPLSEDQLFGEGDKWAGVSHDTMILLFQMLQEDARLRPSAAEVHDALDAILAGILNKRAVLQYLQETASKQAESAAKLAQQPQPEEPVALPDSLSALGFVSCDVEAGSIATPSHVPAAAHKGMALPESLSALGFILCEAESTVPEALVPEPAAFDETLSALGFLLSKVEPDWHKLLENRVQTNLAVADTFSVLGFNAVEPTAGGTADVCSCKNAALMAICANATTTANGPSVGCGTIGVAASSVKTGPSASSVPADPLASHGQKTEDELAGPAELLPAGGAVLHHWGSAATESVLGARAGARCWLARMMRITAEWASRLQALLVVSMVVLQVLVALLEACLLEPAAQPEGDPGEEGASVWREGQGHMGLISSGLACGPVPAAHHREWKGKGRPRRNQRACQVRAPKRGSRQHAAGGVGRRL